MAKRTDPRDPRDPLEALRAVLTDLDLTTVARRLPDLLAWAENAHPAYSEFLREVLDAEGTARWERKVQRRVRWSRLGPEIPLDNFDWSARPQISPQVVKEILTCRFVEERRNLILVGRPSTGKTTVARAIGHAACRRGMSVYSGSLAEVLSALHASSADGTYRKAFRRVTQPDLLVLDDAGFADLDRGYADELFRLVCARHRQRSMIVVTNLPFKQWGVFMPSPAQAVAIADRLIDQATILRFTGRPFRTPRDVHGAPLDGE